MNIYSKSFYGTHHSWAVVMRSIMLSFLKKGHNISIKSINGYEFLQESLEPYIDNFSPNIDLEICYTMPINFPDRFKKKSKIKMAIYNYESSIIPSEWKDYENYLDYILPSSEFSRDIFLNSGFSKDKCIAIPHGIFKKDYESKERLEFLDNLDTFKFLNISIPHFRKNIDILVDAYYNCFSKKDDVTLVLKTSLKKPEKYFECDVRQIILAKQQKYKWKELPHLYIIDEPIDNMVALYNSCHSVINCSSGEGFGLPLLEALACKKIIIAPNKGGHVDFLNHSNSILISSKEVNAPSTHQYWKESKGSKIIQINYNDLCSNMLLAYNHYSRLKNRFNFEIKDKFTWEGVADKILEIT